MKKFGINVLKWIAGIIVFLCLSPWFICSIVGAIIGSAFSAFMTGFKKGVTAYAKISLNLSYLHAVAQGSKMTRETMALIEDYPGGVDRLFTDYSTIKDKKAKTKFIFDKFGADHTAQVRYYLDNQYGQP